MPKNKGKGGKNRRRGKNENENTKRDLILKDDGQSYAQVTRILGNGYVEAFCFDNSGGKKRLCHIRGKLRKKQWINQGDIILVGLRDYQDDKADVLMKYLADEARELKRNRQIPENINIIETSTNPNEGLDDIIFDERYEGKESDDDENNFPQKNVNRLHDNNSLSDEASGSDDDSHYFYNPNRIPSGSGNLNAKNLSGTKKDGGKRAEKNRRTDLTASDSDVNDEIAAI